MSWLRALLRWPVRSEVVAMSDVSEAPSGGVGVVAVADPPVDGLTSTSSDGPLAEQIKALAAGHPKWKARYDRWEQCPGSMAMENTVCWIDKVDRDAFAVLGGERVALPLQILADGATAALMHLNPGSVCMDCQANECCPRERYDASDLV
jgi:hypothetical protein